MAETLAVFDVPIPANGGAMTARACGRQREDGLWEGWIEFEDETSGEVVRTERETTQPNRTDAIYWASGLTPVYLEGALRRTLARPRREITLSPPAFDGPAQPAARTAAPASDEAVLDPFSVYEKNPDVLAQELTALRAWHLRAIIRRYELVDLSDIRIDRMHEPELARLILERVAALSGHRR